MVYYDDLTFGEVIRFDNRRPHNMFGWIKVTEGDPDDIGKTVWFHYNDGQFVRPSYDDVYGFEWIGPALPFRQLARLALPTPGDIIAFEWSENAKGPKALPWVHEHELRGVAMMGGADELRIVRTDGTVIWHGWHRADMQLISTISGQLPREFSDNVTIELNMPDDIYDSLLGDSTIISGGWETYASQEDIWTQLVQAGGLVAT